MKYYFADIGFEEEILDFANFVFSQAHRPHDFKKLLPKVYAKNDFAPLHAVAVDDKGKIRGMVGLYENTIVLKDIDTLSYGYVGTVSVHPYSRGEGHMNALMPMIDERAKEKKLDILVLGGARQRYQYYGYEKGGSQIQFNIALENIKHALKNVEADNISFSEIREDEADFVKNLHKQLKSYCVRENFTLTLKTWEHTPYIIKSGDKVLGYVSADNRGNIYELVLSQLSALNAFVKAWFNSMAKKAFFIQLSPLDTELIEGLSSFAEDYSITDAYMIKVLNWPKVLEALLKLKASCETLIDGEKFVKIDDTVYRIRVENNSPSVKIKDNSQSDICLSSKEATQLFLSDISPFTSRKNKLFNWLNLPLVIPSADAF